jgi:hypothetical protein
LLRQRRIALMIDEGHVELGTAEIGQACRRGERQIAKLRMRIVDDVERHLDRGLGGLARRGGIAGQRKQHADLDGIGRACRDRGKGRRCGEAGSKEQACPFHFFFHFFLPRRHALLVSHDAHSGASAHCRKPDRLLR